MVLIARMVPLAANWFFTDGRDQHTERMTLSSGTPVAADCLESFMQECRDIYRRVSLTAETDWYYWTFSGQYSTVAELDFNELRFSLTGWVYFLIEYGLGFVFFKKH